MLELDTAHARIIFNSFDHKNYCGTEEKKQKKKEKNREGDAYFTCYVLTYEKLNRGPVRNWQQQ